MVCGGLADRAEQHPREAAVAAGADDEQLGVLRRVDERLGRVALDRLELDVDVVRVADDLLTVAPSRFS